MWKLTREFCESIPQGKAENVVFTLTDYKPNATKDIEIIDTLCQEYKNVYLWLQGSEDYEYAKKLGILEKVQLVSPSLSAYDSLLERDDVDTLEQDYMVVLGLFSINEEP